IAAGTPDLVRELRPWNRFHARGDIGYGAGSTRVEALPPVLVPATVEAAMVTIREVAAHAGVGAGTVSRVLNDSTQVSPATRARVLESIALLQYRPNPLARGLSRGRGQTIGVIVPFFTQASAVERLRGVVATLAGSRYDLVLFDVESPEHRAEHVATLNRQRADGLLVMSLPLADDELGRITGTGMAVVLVDAQHAGLPAVVTDDTAGGRIA